MKSNSNSGIKDIKLKTSKETALRTKLKVLNGILGLTPKEIETLEVLIQLNNTTPAKTADRVKAVELLKMNNIQSLNNVIQALKTKGAIQKHPERDEYMYHKIIPTNDKVNSFFIRVQITD